MQESDILQKMLVNPGGVSTADFERMEREWPYFVYPSLLWLENGVADAAHAQRLRTRIALAVGDRDALTRVLDPDSDFPDFYPDMKPVKLGTNDTIDAFLDRFGVGAEKETDLLTRMIFDSSARACKSTVAIATDEQPRQDAATDATASRIDAYLAANATQQMSDTLQSELPYPLEQIEAEPTDNNDNNDNNAVTSTAEAVEEKTDTTAEAQTQPTLTLSLAQIMIRNRNYTKALEIMDKLNLESNEKNSTFADQIRFLRKLIVNQNYK